MDFVNIKDQVEYLFHHLFLPPKLPGGDDSSVLKTIFLMEFVQQSLRRFADVLVEEDAATIQPAISMLREMQLTTDVKGFLDQDGVESVLRRLSRENPVALFHVVAQNAGLLIRRMEDSVCFETFELSPTNAAAMVTKGRLVRQFPDTATKISDKEFDNKEFQQVLANTLVKMSYQKVAEAQPTARKSRADHHEERETTDPMIVNELLTSFLRGVGVQAHINGIRKNTREETSYNSSKLPWRRSPTWLLIRVGLQLTMTRLTGGSDDTYKRFMVFLMAHALIKANEASASSEVLHIMMTKISHRLCKLKELRDDEWLSTVQAVVSEASKILDVRWERIRSYSEPQLDINTLASSETQDRFFFSLPDIDNFIASIQRRGSNDDTSTFRPVAHIRPLDAYILPDVCIPQDRSYLSFSLAMVESWVQTNLDEWITKHIQEETACGSLKALLEIYHSRAKDFYSGRPEGASQMLLTIGEIWVGADRSALYHYPLLKEYDSEVPTMIWQALLLQSKVDMARLHRLESYLASRNGASNRPSVFRSFGVSMSFPVQYFQSSSMLQTKKQRIEEKAELHKQAKIEEFYQLKTRYNDLMQRYNSTPCRQVYVTELGVTFPTHDPHCNRCSLKDQANNLQITVHEWPLPTNNLQAQATVFELGIPQPFAEWRDVTYYMIHDVMSFKSFGQRPSLSYSLDSYSGLSAWCNSWPSRVHLLSETKPHLQTHRSRKSIAVSGVADVHVQNGLNYHYHDRDNSSFISPFTESLAVSDLCTYKLPDRAQALTRFLVHTWLQPNGETPNQVIASQHTCPDHMTLGEFKALAVLPYGYRLQWMSILTQLAMPTVDFNQEETAIFLLQMSLQAGPSTVSQNTRDTHTRLTGLEFGRQLLKGLSDAVSRIEKNWESHAALCSFTLLTTRLLSLASLQLSQDVLGLLAHCRDVSYQWLLTLNKKVQDTADDMQRKELLESVLDIAMICLQTFHVDDKHLMQILMASEQASVFLECSMAIYNATPTKNKSQSALQRIMTDRTQKTLHLAYSTLVYEVVFRRNECLDLAIKRNWPDFSRTADWSLASGTCYWLETNSGRRQVNLNVLTGELLVNGAPLARLPRDYSIHEDYGRLFGSMILDVMPSDAPGMRFSATRKLLGYTVHFGMQGQDLLVHLHKSKAALDLVPSRMLKGKVPDQLADNFAHWYQHESKGIEFCELQDHWAPNNQESWKFRQGEGNWKLSLGNDVFLVAPSSTLAKRIATILDPLEAPLGLHLVYDAVKQVTEIRIPKLRLEFLYKLGGVLIHSRQFRDMHIDSDQSTGTLVGLKSKLVLSSIMEPAHRSVLIPEGEVQYEMKIYDHSDKHAVVKVVHGSARRVQAYKLDDLLGRLVGSTRTESRLYLAYLHALTSFCRPDPFIERTGTEEALDIMGSAIVRAPSVLTETSYSILGRITSLSPTRSFYPKNEKLMQVTKWSSKLSCMSQDDRFYKVVLEILARCREICFLYPKHEVPASPNHSYIHLVERAINRGSTAHVSGFGAEDFTTQHDVIYTPRTQGNLSARSLRAQEIAFRVYHNESCMIEKVGLDFPESLYQRLSVAPVENPRRVPPKSTMQYDSRWLQETETFLSSNWCQIHYAFQKQRQWLNRFELMAWIATMSYSKHFNPRVVQALLMMAQSDLVSAVPLPSDLSFDLQQGYRVVQPDVNRVAQSVGRPIASCPESSLPSLPGETSQKLLARRRRQCDQNKSHAVKSFNSQLCKQWPCAVPSMPQGSEVDTYLKCKDAMKQLMPKWSSWYKNLRFKEYLQEIYYRLDEVPIQALKLQSQPERVTAPSQHRPLGFISTDDLFRNPISDDNVSILPVVNVSLQEVNKDLGTVDKLTGIIDDLEFQAKLPYQYRYLNELRQSVSSLTERAENELEIIQSNELGYLFRENLDRQTKHATKVDQNLIQGIFRTQLTRRDGSSVPKLMESILSDSRYLPRMTASFILQQLKPSHFSRLNETWKMAIIQWATCIAAVQRAKRLMRFQSSPVDLLRELQNPGHDTWEARDHPEWLLLECESEIMIRDVQQQVTQIMVNPPEEKNAVMQLNMGEGKSTVIVPMVATALADGCKMVRVIVAKPQAKQMHQMLVSKLAGLLDRPVYLLPFSRDIRMDAQRADSIHRLVKDCMAEGGILMVQPEHLLSLQLMELECHLNSNKGAAGRLRMIRDLFDHASRDIVDESDENFSVKFELIYTLGQQCSIEDSPSRWSVVQEILGLVAQVAGEVKPLFSKSLEFDHRSEGQYPTVRFLQADAGEEVLHRVASHICKKGMYGFPISHQPETFRKAVQRYITQWEVTQTDIDLVETSRFFDGASVGRVLLLRGLFAGGILAFALGQKRWRVNYGVDPQRQSGTKLAVPFRAKDSPSPRSEFSHPDVVITLTCLTYYYGGLDQESLLSAFRLLVKSDNARTEYHEWTRTAPTLPSPLKTLEGVSLRDRAQFQDEIYPHLRYSKLAIDYYLSHLVFSKEAKEFPHKLSASGWDLSKVKDHPTTGFSGTNDSRYVLPTDIKQLDLPQQKHTNALVLGYLLQPQNGVTLVPDEAKGAPFNSQMLLHMISGMDTQTRVVLDVGAQVIDLTNLQFAKQWLAQYQNENNTQAVICFNDDDEIVVLDRSGKVEDLEMSPFSEQLDRCLVFLDESHTRGTDLKLPPSYRAVVTLGVGLTKDRLVQACMRMRKLGKGQSVQFCVPWEIEQKIGNLKSQQKAGNREITISDVLNWVISETCLDLRKAIPLWLNQGVRFSRQQALWSQYRVGDGSQWAGQFLEDESQSLDQRYRPRNGRVNLDSFLEKANNLKINVLRARCDDFGLTELHTASLQEEQERELSPETEQERQVEKPPAAEPEPHSISEPLRDWILEGPVSTSFKAVCVPAFRVLKSTSAAQHFNLQSFPSSIRATPDFAKTVKGAFGINNYSDSFQRPVQWILAGKYQAKTTYLVIISPFEAQQLLPLIQRSQFVGLHLYAPRVNLAFQSLDHLQLYRVSGNPTADAIPRKAVLFLNLFSGQLYLSCFKDYTRICDLLGLVRDALDDDVVLGADGFIPPGTEGGLVNKSKFRKSPVQFLRVLIERVRQDCGSIEKTDIGRIFEGVRLLERDFNDRI
ncbi:uncharacterized protein FIESC28_05317 [Fusarium coffeatum]|uniref:ubiquitinyl hydrolase 1 n=1 Tax=Fusarium coffeatum TaxID=231269 RepID=A0A366RTF0_9HYPO|nr:uncharacterized protein FIESC28_05317 [Fusarium coffeatum]RBR20353.1 hypothetical protein FIESC28_05317 [Fusarium coffeatum]